jgi:S-adenosylmethionine decarboxylase
LYDILDTDLLKYLWRGMSHINTIINELNLTVVNKASHQFDPFGYTFAYVLSESHLTIHTYPEHNSCYIDIFCCNPNFDPFEAVRVIKRVFDTNSATYEVIIR